MCRYFSPFVLACVYLLRSIAPAAEEKQPTPPESPAYRDPGRFEVEFPLNGEYPHSVPGTPSPFIGGSGSLWQIDPFGVGYNLLSGFRPIYSGARQPIGHEIIPTHPNGNGYVYRPIFAPSPGYHYTTPGGALIIEYPQQHPTRADAEFPTLPPPIAVPAPLELGQPLAPPPIPTPPRSTLREF